MYAKVNNGKVEIYPYTIGDLRKDNPAVSFPGYIDPDTLETYGVVEVRATAKPDADHTKNVTEGTPELKDGAWVQKWEVETATAGQIEVRTNDMAAIVRAQRDRLLAECDWTQLPDAKVDAAAWATYRDALRDVTDQAGFPWSVEYPTKP